MDQVDIWSDEVPLSSRDPPVFERVAVAYALAQSVRLGSLELRIERSIARTRDVPRAMAHTGEVSLSNRQVTKMMGEMFGLRHQVNLETDILETPELFWEYSEHEPLYERCRQHLDVDRRVTILNQRFEVMQDLFDFLEEELNIRHGNRLEWVVIVLCAVEPCLFAMRLYQKDYYDIPLENNATNSSHSAVGLDGSSAPWVGLLEFGRMPILGIARLGTLGFLVRHLVVKPAAFLATGLFR